MSQVLVAIVDDDKCPREALGGLVRSLGHNASTFGSAEEFLRSEKLRDTSCLITDLQMPGLSGLDLQDRLNFAVCHDNFGKVLSHYLFRLHGNDDFAFFEDCADRQCGKDNADQGKNQSFPAFFRIGHFFLFS